MNYNTYNEHIMNNKPYNELYLLRRSMHARTQSPGLTLTPVLLVGFAPNKNDIYIYIYMSLSLSISIYMYTYISLSLYIYIYTQSPGSGAGGRVMRRRGRSE